MTQPQNSLDVLSSLRVRDGTGRLLSIDETIVRAVKTLDNDLEDIMEGNHNGMEIKETKSLTKPQRAMECLELALKPVLTLAQGLAMASTDNKGWHKLSDKFDDRAKLGQNGLNLTAQGDVLTEAVNHWLSTVAYLESEDTDILPKNRIPAGQIGKPLAINDAARTTNEIPRVTAVLALEDGWQIKSLVSDEKAADLLARSPHHRAAEIS